MNNTEVLKYLESRALTYNEVTTSLPCLKHSGLIPLDDVIGFLEMSQSEQNNFLANCQFHDPGMLNKKFNRNREIPLNERVITFSILGARIWFYETFEFRFYKLKRRLFGK